MPVAMGGRTRTVVAALAGLLAVGGSPAASASPGWTWPLDGPRSVSRPFEPPATRYGPGHRGADLAGWAGQAVRAAGPGRISYAGLLAGRGVVVVVHGELRTTYEPVTATAAVGQQVAAGQVIGRLDPGHPGCPGACLHWGLRRGGAYLDPVRLVRAGPSRLLPLDRPAGAAAQLSRPPGRFAAAPGASAHPSAGGSAPRPAADPPFTLRAADAAWGSGALAALIAGLVLLRRPRRPPDGPAAPPLPAAPRAPSVAAVAAGTAGPAARLVDLASERNRRRPDVA